MPTYTYKCSNKKCKTFDIEFEIIQKMADDRLEECPQCEKEKLKKVITPSGGFRIGGLGVHKPTAHWGG